MILTKRTDISKIRKAVYLMIESHDGVFRKFSGEEYAWHPVRVAKIIRGLKKSKNKEDIIIACLCHDLVEDTNVTLELIEKLFGNLVASIVNELTNDPVAIQKYGKSVYMLNKMLNMSSYPLIIKLADRLDNCSDLEIGTEKFRNKYVKETRFILNGIGERYLSENHKFLIEKINSKISIFES